MEISTTHHWKKWDGVIPLGAVHASERYLVARAPYNNEWIPGKFHTTDHKCYIPWGQKEHEVNLDVEILVAAPGTLVEWIPHKNGEIPMSGAIGPMGTDGLYVGKAICPSPESVFTPGKIHPKYGKLFIPWGGKESEHTEYEALRIVFAAPKVEVIEIVEAGGHHHPHHHH